MPEIKLSKPQENKFSMFRDLETVLDRNRIIIERIPELSDSVSKFKNVVEEISIKAVMKNTVLKGAFISKTNKRIELESVMIENAAALSAFGAKTENEMIKAVAGISPSSLDRLRDTEILNKAKSILDIIKDNSSALASYSVTPEDIEKFKTCIENYRTSSSETSGSKTDSLIINKSLQDLFNYGMQILSNEVDKMVDALKNKEKNFYDSYYAVRTIKKLGIRHKKQAENITPVNTPAS